MRALTRGEFCRKGSRPAPAPGNDGETILVPLKDSNKWSYHHPTVDGRNLANQLIWRIHHHLQGFIHLKWCRISSVWPLFWRLGSSHTPKKPGCFFQVCLFSYSFTPLQQNFFDPNWSDVLNGGAGGTPLTNKKRSESPVHAYLFEQLNRYRFTPIENMYTYMNIYYVHRVYFLYVVHISVMSILLGGHTNMARDRRIPQMSISVPFKGIWMGKKAFHRTYWSHNSHVYILYQACAFFLKVHFPMYTCQHRN